MNIYPDHIVPYYCLFSHTFTFPFKENLINDVFAMSFLVYRDIPLPPLYSVALSVNINLQ